MRGPVIPFESSTLPLGEYLETAGEVFTAFLHQDSDCVSFGVHAAGERWFVKAATSPQGCRSLERATALHGAVRHPAFVPLVGSFTAAGWPVTVYPWVSGEVLYHPAEPDRRDLARTRFVALPSEERLDAIATIVDAHRMVVDAGFVAVDLYDGCMLYDFDRSRMRLVDLDEYRPGPFRVPGDRLPGSTRFMAPEESVRGAMIDERTTVFNLGRTIQVLVPDGSDELRALAERACAVERSGRFGSVTSLSEALESLRQQRPDPDDVVLE